ncbi:MAG: hypothetical protein JST92_20620 [Deltaproteobacteria bacterium]|nr:hypothetical protein [Deltaproteobacteria bacterium]
MKLKVRHAGGELEVPSQKELTHLWQLGFIHEDDLVLREGSDTWTKAKDLPWMRGTIATDKRENKMFWFVVAFMVVSLGFVLFARGKTRLIADRVVSPPGSTQAKSTPQGRAQPGTPAPPAGQK